MNFHTLSPRFWAKVRKTDSCWLWTAAVNERGYGRFQHNGQLHYPHRLALEAKLGRSLSAGMQACHNCPGGDNPACVNPDHLWEGTNRNNSEDALRKGRILGTRVVGTENGKAKLNDALIPEIRRVSEEHSYEEAARRFGIAPNTARSITLRKTWRHVP